MGFEWSTAIKLLFIILVFPIILIANEFTIVDSLPSNLPVIKKILWGEKGLIRQTPFAPKSRIEEYKLRRKMLQTHQKLGTITLGLMAMQAYYGHQLIDGNYDNRHIHKTLSYALTGTYFTTASFSIFAPPARKYSQNISSIKLHKWLSIIHFTGMIVQPWLGYQSANTSNGFHAKQYKDWHVQAGNITFVSFALAFLTTLLPY